MNQYNKYIDLKGSYFTRVHKKKSKHGDKLRYLREETVAKEFLKGSATVIVHIEELDSDIELDNFSDPELIRTYLGDKFIER